MVANLLLDYYFMMSYFLSGFNLNRNHNNNTFVKFTFRMKTQVPRTLSNIVWIYSGSIFEKFESVRVMVQLSPFSGKPIDTQNSKEHSHFLHIQANTELTKFVVKNVLKSAVIHQCNERDVIHQSRGGERNSEVASIEI